MLRNGLGSILLEQSENRDNVFDLFTGSGAVARFVASKTNARVYACDLQGYGAVLAGAVICREGTIDAERLWRNWRARAFRILRSCSDVLEMEPARTKRDILSARRWCGNQKGKEITKAYGGHYYSPLQAIWIDSLRATLPASGHERTVALAALIDAASECAASPGHTAQPFQPTASAKQHLLGAWSRSVPNKVRLALRGICAQFANRAGTAVVGDAFDVVEKMAPGDLAFLDPPYSAVHYSRFYHVLEAIASGYVGDVAGVGRYPPPEMRPRSSYSVKRESVSEFERLLQGISEKQADAVVTFPDHVCSNGLSGALIRKIGSKYFDVIEVSVKSKLSTLGGAGIDSISDEVRGARRETRELIMVMKSR